LFAFAGLFEAWRVPPAAVGESKEAPDRRRTPEGDWLLSCCIVTTEANPLMAPIHDRMPLILPPEAWADWLARGQTDATALAPLLQAQPDAGAMQAWPVARAVGRASADGPGLIAPLPAQA
jgi:putative SOS response-associated peptidase YedK